MRLRGVFLGDPALKSAVAPAAAAAAVHPTAAAIPHAAAAAAGTIDIDPFGPGGTLGGSAQVTALSIPFASHEKQAPPRAPPSARGADPFGSVAALDPFAVVGATPRGGATAAFGAAAAPPPPQYAAAGSAPASVATAATTATATAAAADPNNPFAFGSAAAQPFR